MGNSYDSISCLYTDSLGRKSAMNKTITQQLNSSIQRSMIEKDQLIEELKKENDFLRKQLFEEDGCTVFIALNNGREIFCKFHDCYDANCTLNLLLHAKDREIVRIECENGTFNFKGSCIDVAGNLRHFHYI